MKQMAVYKDAKTNTWRVIFRYTDWTGERKQTQKCGFPTKREALAWKREQQNKSTADLDMTFERFAELYEKDAKPRLKENAQIETEVRLSGLTKQDYIIKRLLCRDVIVQGNPRVYKALRDQFATVLDELRHIEAGGRVDDELLDIIEMIAVIMNGMKEDVNEA